MSRAEGVAVSVMFILFWVTIILIVTGKATEAVATAILCLATVNTFERGR
jgi:hypothetical protein